MKALIPLLLLVALGGCATTSQITKGSADYLAVATVSEKLKGHSFYLAIGDVDLYRHNWTGKVVPTGHTAEAAAAVQVDSATGQVQKLVTLQPTVEAPSDWLNAAAVAGAGPYAVGDLVGGIAVIDIQPHPTWLDTLEALQKATKTLGSSEANAAARRWYRSTVIIAAPFPQPVFHFGWDWEHHRRHRY
jgi:hypothetical protein